MLLIILLQIAIPLLLVAWLLFRPQRSMAGGAAQVAASLLLLEVLARAGVWLFPPWWFPRVAQLVIVIATIIAMRRHFATMPLLPGRAAAWIMVALFMIAGIAAVLLLFSLSRAVLEPAGIQLVDLSSPLGAGDYLIVNGGGAQLINAHRASMDSANTRLQPWRGNGHAIDIVAIDQLGLRSTGILPSDPAEYRIFGRAVLAPCDGNVIVAVDGLPDMTVPVYDHTYPAGNHVMLECAGVHIVLAHLREGTVRVNAGDGITVGDTLGEVGNSGGSDEPHLHIHAQRPGTVAEPMSGEPLPVRIQGRYLVRGSRFRSGGS